MQTQYDISLSPLGLESNRGSRGDTLHPFEDKFLRAPGAEDNEDLAPLTKRRKTVSTESDLNPNLLPLGAQQSSCLTSLTSSPAPEVIASQSDIQPPSPLTISKSKANLAKFNLEFPSLSQILASEASLDLTRLSFAREGSVPPEMSDTMTTRVLDPSTQPNSAIGEKRPQYPDQSPELSLVPNRGHSASGDARSGIISSAASGVKTPSYTDMLDNSFLLENMSMRYDNPIRDHNDEVSAAEQGRSEYQASTDCPPDDADRGGQDRQQQQRSVQPDVWSDRRQSAAEPYQNTVSTKGPWVCSARSVEGLMTDGSNETPPSYDRQPVTVERVAAASPSPPSHIMRENILGLDGVDFSVDFHGGDSDSNSEL